MYIFSFILSWKKKNRLLICRLFVSICFFFFSFSFLQNFTFNSVYLHFLCNCLIYWKLFICQRAKRIKDAHARFIVYWHWSGFVKHFSIRCSCVGFGSLSPAARGCWTLRFSALQSLTTWLAQTRAVCLVGSDNELNLLIRDFWISQCCCFIQEVIEFNWF